VNYVVLTGSVYKDATKIESKYPEKPPMYFFTMLVDANTTSSRGNMPEPELLRVKVWGEKWGNIASKLKQGNKLFVMGSVRSWWSKEHNFFEYYILAIQIELMEKNFAEKFQRQNEYAELLESESEKAAREKADKDEDDIPF